MELPSLPSPLGAEESGALQALHAASAQHDSGQMRLALELLRRSKHPIALDAVAAARALLRDVDGRAKALQRLRTAASSKDRAKLQAALQNADAIVALAECNEYLAAQVALGEAVHRDEALDGAFDALNAALLSEESAPLDAARQACKECSQLAMTPPQRKELALLLDQLNERQRFLETSASLVEQLQAALDAFDGGGGGGGEGDGNGAGGAKRFERLELVVASAWVCSGGSGNLDEKLEVASSRLADWQRAGLRRCGEFAESCQALQLAAQAGCGFPVIGIANLSRSLLSVSRDVSLDQLFSAICRELWPEMKAISGETWFTSCFAKLQKLQRSKDTDIDVDPAAALMFLPNIVATMLPYIAEDHGFGAELGVCFPAQPPEFKLHLLWFLLSELLSKKSFQKRLPAQVEQRLEPLLNVREATYFWLMDAESSSMDTVTSCLLGVADVKTNAWQTMALTYEECSSLTGLDDELDEVLRSELLPQLKAAAKKQERKLRQLAKQVVTCLLLPACCLPSCYLLGVTCLLPPGCS